MNLNWRKSSYSGGEGNCVEVADHSSRVLVRDTKDRTGPTLQFTPDAWVRFAKQVKADASLASDLSPSLYGELLSYGGSSLCCPLALGSRWPWRALGRPDSTRLLGGTLGVAVIGSVYASLYGSRLTASLPAGLPRGVSAIAHQSLGAAYAVSGQVAAAGHGALGQARNPAEESARS
jgi:hypothetical protein